MFCVCVPQVAKKEEELKDRLKHEQEKLSTTLKEVKDAKKIYEKVSGEGGRPPGCLAVGFCRDMAYCCCTPKPIVDHPTTYCAFCHPLPP